jgi:hypothetical protein
MSLIMKLSRISGVCLLIASGCGEKEEPICGGHGQPVCAGEEFKNHEGGEVRLEVRVLPDLKNVGVAQAWFVTAQVPEKLPSATFETCTNVAAMPYTLSPNADVIASRQFYDVGANISISGAGTTFTLDKHTDTADFRGQVEGIIYLKDGKASGSVPIENFVPGGEYTATFANNQNPTDSVYLPKGWQSVAGPAFDGTLHTFVRGQDMTFSYTPEDTFEDAPIAFIQFKGKDGSNMFCPHDTAGTFTVPASVIDQIGAEGTVIAGVISHKRVNYNERNLDLIGVNCKLQSYKVE